MALSCALVPCAGAWPALSPEFIGESGARGEEQAGRRSRQAPGGGGRLLPPPRVTQAGRNTAGSGRGWRLERLPAACRQAWPIGGEGRAGPGSANRR